MNSDDHDAFAATLELRVLQHLGQSLDYRWHWPAEASECSLQQVLAALRSDARQQALLACCTLQRLGPPTQTVWVLGHTQEALDCRVNQAVLRANSQLRLRHGDQIRLGDTLLHVHLQPPVHAASAQDSLHAQHVAALEKMQAGGADVQAQWQQLVQHAHGTQVDPLQQWMADAARTPDLGALLQPLRHMEPMLQGLQALGSKDMLAPETFDQLLHLYAPDDQHLPVRTSIQGVLQGSLPSLSPEQQALLQEQEQERARAAASKPPPADAS